MSEPTKPRKLRAALAWAAALALAAASLAHAAAWLYYSEAAAATTMTQELGLPTERLLQPPVRLGFQLRYDTAAAGVRVREVDPGGAAERAGLRRGDLIVAVDGRSLEHSPAPYLAAYRAASPGDPIELTVVRAGEQEPIVLTGLFEARPLTDRLVPVMRFVDGSLRLFPVVFLAVALPVLFLRIEDPHAWRAALLLIGVAGVARTPAVFERVDVPLFALAMAWKGACTGLLAFLAYLFFSTFPARSPLDRRLPWLRWVLLGLGFLHALGGADPARLGHAWLPAWLAGALGDAATSALWHAYNYGGLALALAALVATDLSSPSRDARRKIRVLVLGAVAGLLPVLVVSGLNDLGVWRAPGWIASLVYVVIVFFPLSFAYAVVKHRVLELPVLLRRSARYLLVKRGFMVLLVLVAAQASALFAVSFSRVLRVTPALATTAGVGFGFLLAGAAAPLVRRATRVIDRSFFRDAYDARVVLQELAERIRLATSREELAALLRRQLERALHPVSTVVYLDTPGGGLRTDDEGVPAAWRDVPAGAPLLAELARRGTPLQLAADSDQRAGALPAPPGAECLVPIVGRGERALGLVALGPRLSEEPYSADDERLLRLVASQAGTALENMALAERIAERLQAEHRVAHEMELARRVQAKLLPQAGPRLRSIEYAGRCVQARAVGGDYYDFLEGGEGRVGLVLADVSGKGLAAALLVASLHASLRSQPPTDGDPAAPLRTVNRLLFHSTEASRYATLFLGHYDDTGRLRYANCGHNPPFVLRRDGSRERLTATAMVVGLVEDWEPGTAETVLGSGDLLAVYSDGLTEATDGSGEEFGEDRLARTIEAHRDRDVASVLDAVFDEIRRFSVGEQADDQTMVIARVR